ncbi:hypothetical protein T03_6287 [Trichinella britovi]|uniref:Uncharacterized protein n=1 Tax=Trichinella britovi TaxID=45882 RepID=A0A0V1DCW9_TRIBR|nr:hypothetical protein T03_6287 [Trichinella britovi]
MIASCRSIRSIIYSNYFCNENMISAFSTIILVILSSTDVMGCMILLIEMCDKKRHISVMLLNNQNHALLAFTCNSVKDKTHSTLYNDKIDQKDSTINKKLVNQEEFNFECASSLVNIGKE